MVVSIFCSILRGPTFHSRDSTARNSLRVNQLAREICELRPNAQGKATPCHYRARASIHSQNTPRRYDERLTNGQNDRGYILAANPSSARARHSRSTCVLLTVTPSDRIR